MPAAVELFAAGGFHCQTDSHLRDILGVGGMKPRVVQDLYVGRQIHISGTTAGTIVLAIPTIYRHPDRQIRPARKKRYMHARKYIGGAVVIITEITIRRQFKAQMAIGSSVQHLGHRKSIRSEIQGRYTCRLPQIGCYNRYLGTYRCAEQYP